MHASQKTICVLLIIIFAFEGMLLTFLPCLQVLANTRAKRGVGDDAPMNDFMNSRGHHKGGSGVKMKKPARSFSKKSWKVSKSKKPHENESSISDNVEPTQRRLQNQRQSQQAEHRQLKTSSSSSSGTQLPHGVKPRISSSSTSGHGTMAVVAAEGLLPQSPALNASTSGSSSSSGSGTPSSNSHDSTGGSHRSGGGGVITIYLATDALDLREQVECSPQCLFYLCAAFLALLLLSTIILK
jgi:hypothetical protein